MRNKCVKFPISVAFLFNQIEEFWSIFQHIRKPDSTKSGVELHMFRDGIVPIWEDEANKTGGKITLKLKKDFTTIIWEEIIFAIIGDVFPKTTADMINGVAVSIRRDCNIVQIWFSNFANQKKVKQLEWHFKQGTSQRSASNSELHRS